MAEILAPDPDEFTIEGLDLLAPAQVNRSPWTGRSKTLGLAGAERWTARAAVGPITTEADERPWRAFLFALRGPVNEFKLPLPCQTHAGNRPTVGAGAGNGYTLPLAGLAVSQTILKAGQFMTVPLPSGHKRLVMLRADLVSDAGGTATAQIEPALNETPTLGATVETIDPYLWARQTGGNSSLESDGSVSAISFNVEEAL